MNRFIYFETQHVKTNYRFHTKRKYYQKKGFYARGCDKFQALSRGLPCRANH